MVSDTVAAAVACPLVGAVLVVAHGNSLRAIVMFLDKLDAEIDLAYEALEA